MTSHLKFPLLVALAAAMMFAQRSRADYYYAPWDAAETGVTNFHTLDGIYREIWQEDYVRVAPFNTGNGTLTAVEVTADLYGNYTYSGAGYHTSDWSNNFLSFYSTLTIDEGAGVSFSHVTGFHYQVVDNWMECSDDTATNSQALILWNEIGAGAYSTASADYWEDTSYGPSDMIFIAHLESGYEASAPTTTHMSGESIGDVQVIYYYDPF